MFRPRGMDPFEQQPIVKTLKNMKNLKRQNSEKVRHYNDKLCLK
jgi:hypothetical protein